MGDKMKRIFLCVLFSYMAFESFSQSKFEVTFAIGHRSNYSAVSLFVFGYKINPKLIVELGPRAGGYYGGHGLTGGVKGEIFKTESFKFELLSSLRYSVSRTINLHYDDDTKKVKYSYPSSLFAFFGVGVSVYLKKDKQDRLGVNFGYLLPFEKYESHYIEGNASQEIEQKIKNTLIGGFGFSIIYSAGF